jgi:hypothetical protein
MKKLVGMILVSLFVGGFAMAKHDSPCKDDMKKLCGDVKGDHDAKMMCMKEHADQLSDACKKHVEEYKDKTKAMMDACNDDVVKYCSDVKPGEGRMVKCLKEHKNDVSQACKDEMGKMKKDHDKK